MTTKTQYEVLDANGNQLGKRKSARTYTHAVVIVRGDAYRQFHIERYSKEVADHKALQTKADANFDAIFDLYQEKGIEAVLAAYPKATLVTYEGLPQHNRPRKYHPWLGVSIEGVYYALRMHIFHDYPTPTDLVDSDRESARDCTLKGSRTYAESLTEMMICLKAALGKPAVEEVLAYSSRYDLAEKAKSANTQRDCAQFCRIAEVTVLAKK